MGNQSSTTNKKTSSLNTKDDANITNNENKESTTLLWFDPNIGSREDTERTKQELRRINDYVIFHTDLEQCVKFIQSTDKEKIFLITSGSKASEILPQIGFLRQIDSIFIFCMKKEKYQHLINKYPKIIDIYIHLDLLCKSIEEQSALVDKQLQTFSFYDQNHKSTKDLSKQSAEFLWFQLFNYIITHLPNNEQAKQGMIEICKEYYRGNIQELKSINHFDEKYRADDAIHWYSKQSFIYKLINKALRSEDIYQLYTFRFFINDLSKSLQHEHAKILSSEEQIITVYRGAKLDKEEFVKLKENIGKLISTNGYLSTSRCQSSALKFARRQARRTDVISVLFQIQCQIQQLGKSIVFADISQLSAFPHEEEILFDLNACFQIQSIEKQGEIQFIKMSASNEGQTITKDYLELVQKETEEKSVSIVFGKLMCNLGEYDKSQKYFEQLLIDPNGEDLAWIEFNIGRALYFKSEWTEARKYFDRAYNRMMNEKPERKKDSAYVLNNIGLILENQKKYDEALSYYYEAVKIKEQLDPCIPINVVSTLNNIGTILFKQAKYDEALDYHQRALKIKEEYYPSGHVSIAVSLNNIGIILKEQLKYDEALHYYHGALKIQEKYYPSGHIDVAQSLNNIGLVLVEQEKFDDALNYYQQALKMREKYYPSNHISIAQSHNSIGLILSDQEKYDEALDHHQQALKIRKEHYPSGHVDIATSLSNIGNILYQKRSYKDVFDYHHQALKIYKENYPPCHIDIALTLNVMGAILFQQGKYDEALDYYKQSLKTKEKCYPSDHIGIAQSFYNIGLILHKQRKYDEAFDYHQRALKIQEKHYPSGHVDTAATLYSIGCILDQRKNYDEALKHYLRALEMQEKYYPAGHVEIGISLNSIGACYQDQNMREKALEYYQRALKMYEKFLSSNDKKLVEIEQQIRLLSEK